jgi:hypothetical protein
MSTSQATPAAWDGHAGAFGRSPKSQLVEELHGRTTGSKTRAKQFSPLIIFFDPASCASAGRGSRRSEFESKGSLTLGV